ncbi:pyridoxal phosphate-dependent aminotransferase [uncultured Eubacterium sp.]|uniref:pyridoxal phosphate-dependent aminotransferase n=1 Tax=uncultured Eubacterium sp. TaxID=165185 RepID=UPI000EDEFB59|nr:pyridoxal phosphate-dependent aminotransferase [uncultured Eubacterium sp.]HAH18646.1 pyridoxal phosphate-dependent aminotransferase [Eubacterium sp.]
MISEKMKAYVAGSSAIRAMFEEGKKMAEKYGAENVYDYSLGNPSIPAPERVKEAIIEVLNEENSLVVHGYMNNSGYEDVRETIAESINKKQGTNFSMKNIIMTVGAAGGLNVILKTFLNPGDEVIVFVPYFGEYRSYVANFDGKIVEVETDDQFMIDAKKLEAAVTPKTKAVIVNNPNNPTGVVYSEEVIKAMAEVLVAKEKEYGTSIYLISDEPYRELAYGVDVPYLTKYYKNTIVGYSYSKSLSLPGERIGYLVIPSEIDSFEDVLSAANTANRILGYVNAPSLMQKVIAKCVDEKCEVEKYRKNGEYLYDNLVKFGFSAVKPQGAFYLFLKSPVEDEKEFVSKAKEFNLLLVPGSSFGKSGYVRLAYCVSFDTVKNSMPAFEKLAKAYNLI